MTRFIPKMVLFSNFLPHLCQPPCEFIYIIWRATVQWGIGMYLVNVVKSQKEFSILSPLKNCVQNLTVLNFLRKVENRPQIENTFWV